MRFRHYRKRIFVYILRNAEKRIERINILFRKQRGIGSAMLKRTDIGIVLNEIDHSAVLVYDGKLANSARRSISRSRFSIMDTTWNSSLLVISYMTGTTNRVISVA